MINQAVHTPKAPQFLITWRKSETIMTSVVKESEDISVDLVSPILNVLKKENTGVPPIARQLGEKVVVNCASKLKPFLLPAVLCSGASLDDYNKVVADVYQAGDEAIELAIDDASKTNLADDENLINLSSEKAMKVAIELTKTVVSNGFLQKGNGEFSAARDKSKGVDPNRQDVKGEPSKTVAENVIGSKPPKSQTTKKSEKPKGENTNSSKRSSKPVEPVESDKKKCGYAKATPWKGKRKTLSKDKGEKASSIVKSSPKAPETRVHGRELVGAKIKVLWPDDDNHFYAGVVASFDVATKKHEILYDDGEVEILNLGKEKWKLIQKPCESSGDESDVEEASRSSSKRKRVNEETTPKTNVYGRELVGATVEVWCRYCHRFNRGVVVSFDAAKKKHKILYREGDEVSIYLQQEKWKFIAAPKRHAGESADGTAGGKKTKISSHLGSKQGKYASLPKKSGYSSEKSKAIPKFACNFRVDSVKNVVKSDAIRVGKSEAARKSKGDDDTPIVQGQVTTECL